MLGWPCNGVGAVLFLPWRGVGAVAVFCWYGPCEVPLCGVGVVLGRLWCDTAVVGGAQGSSGEQRLWCEPVAAGRTPRRESNTETPAEVSSPAILVHLTLWCTWYPGALGIWCT